MSNFGDIGLEVLGNQPVVIDNGSGTIKAGFAGAEMPKVICPAYVGKPKHMKVMAGGVEGDYFCGDKAKEFRGILKLNYPTKHGITTDWKDMQNLWQYAYNELNVVQDQYPVLLTEAPLNPRPNRLRAAEIFFETFNVPALYVQAQAILSLYASGRTTGVVLDSGDGVTNAVPVYEGFILPHAVTRIDVAGRDITDYLQLLLRKAGHNFHTSAELEVVKDIKEKICFVAFNIERIEKEDSEDFVEPEVPYKLPDGNVIQVGPEKFRAPEVLFNPGLIGLEYVGIHQCLVNSISKCDMDIRRSLFSDIILAGGSTMHEGFGDRLLVEVRKLAPRDTKIKIWAPPERILSTWIGGSILASLSTFKKMWITRKEYEESGKNSIYRKTF
jgi:centractin